MTRITQRGQSMVEYLVAGAIVVALIAWPIDGHESALALMLDAIRVAYHKFIAAISLPQ
ncbi:MAG TPA: hypothetical protein VF169_04460 [Albitalea sp.]|uniref:hypothetical protein n=1 Tax=Piscinibacter sp. TaxID=1903157 RepID=UPI002ED6B3C0